MEDIPVVRAAHKDTAQAHIPAVVAADNREVALVADNLEVALAAYLQVVAAAEQQWAEALSPPEHQSANPGQICPRSKQSSVVSKFVSSLSNP